MMHIPSASIAGTGMYGMQQIPAQKPQFIAYEDNSLKIGFTFSKEAPDLHLIRTYFSNKQDTLLTGINLQVAVQKYMKLQMQLPSGQELMPLSQNGITQDIRITNTMEGQKPLVLKIKVTYSINGKQVSETRVINSLPTD